MVSNNKAVFFISIPPSQVNYIHYILNERRLIIKNINEIIIITITLYTRGNYLLNECFLIMILVKYLFKYRGYLNERPQHIRVKVVGLSFYVPLGDYRKSLFMVKGLFIRSFAP